MRKKILMVCLGNICRSPLAEGILASKLDTNHYKVDSASTSNWHIGKQPDQRSIATAKFHQIDISQQKARQFQVSDFDKFDKIFVMDNSNYDNVISLARNESDKQRVCRILDVLYPGENKEIPDPYYGGDEGFEKVYQMLDKACDKIVENLK